MERIEDLRQIRRDGRVIDENTSLKTLFRWEPSIVPRVEWWVGRRRVELRYAGGMLVQMTPDRCGLAVLKGQSPRELFVYNADGTNRLLIRSALVVNGRPYSGTFAWFEEPHVKGPSMVGVVLQLDNRSGDVRLDFDAATGKVLAAFESR